MIVLPHRRRAFRSSEVNPANYGDPGAAKIWLAARKEAYANTDPVSSATEFINGWHFTSSGAARPRFDTGVLGAQPGFFFDNSNDFLSGIAAASLLNGVSSATFALVLKSVSVNQNTVFDFGTATVDVTRLQFDIDGGWPIVYARRLDADSSGSANNGAMSGVTNPHLFMLTMNWATGRISLWIDGVVFINNAAITSSGSTSATNSAAVILGGAKNFGTVWSYFSGHIGEFIAWSPGLDTAARQAFALDIGPIYGLSITP